MIVRIDTTGTLENFTALLDELKATTGVHSVLILVADSNGFTPDTLDPILTRTSLPIFGGIFCQLIHENKLLNRGTIMIGLDHVPAIEIIDDLSGPITDYDQRLETTFLAAEMVNKTMMVFVDGFSKNISHLLESLFIVFGLEINYLGGGAGSNTLSSCHCLLSNRGLLKDVALLALINRVSGTGVRHGWQESSGPYKITESSRNEVVSIDWKPAFEFYRDIIFDDCGQTMTTHNFQEISGGYIFGLPRLGGAEMIARDPLSMTPEGHLICAGDVAQGAFIHILKGNRTTMVEAARQARRQGYDNFEQQVNHGAPELVLVWDCISRKAYLQESYQQELDQLVHPKVPTVGALTIGEIANSGKDFLEFYNNTTVVGVLGGA